MLTCNGFFFEWIVILNVLLHLLIGQILVTITLMIKVLASSVVFRNVKPSWDWKVLRITGSNHWVLRTANNTKRENHVSGWKSRPLLIVLPERLNEPARFWIWLPICGTENRGTGWTAWLCDLQSPECGILQSQQSGFFNRCVERKKM